MNYMKWRWFFILTMIAGVTGGAADIRAEVSAGVGNLSIVTDMMGGVIFLDGTRLDVTTPATLTSIPTGVHNVRIELNGLGFDTTLTIHAGVTEMLQLNRAQLRELPPLEEISLLPSELVTIVTNIELPGCRYLRISPPESGTPFDSFQIALPGEYDIVTSPNGPNVGGLSAGDMRTLAFHRSRAPKWDDESIAIRGVDAVVSILAEGGVVVVSHRFAVDSTMSLRPQSSDLEVGMPVRLARRYTQAPKGCEVSFEIELFINRSTKFATFENLLPIRKQFRLNTDLNDGDEINVRIRVDTDGEIFFRYW